jgi:DNA-binding beta-propeller fold protein YncE
VFKLARIAVAILLLLIAGCGESDGSLPPTVPPGLTLSPKVVVSPATATVAPGGAVVFTVTGGTAPYTFSLVSAPSGGQIDPKTGAYRAGARGGVVDVVAVTDSADLTSAALVNVGPALRLTPAAGTVAPGQSLTFTTSGGSGTGLIYTLVNNLSGGSIDSSTGVYTAGPTGETTDVVRVVDSLGNRVTALISVGPSVRISPGTATVAPSSSIEFSATGGSETGYTFSLATNLSGATINPSTGLYVAGRTGGVTDVVEISDSLGNSVTAQVNVGPAVSLSPTTATVAPKGTQSFTASGGSGAGYTYSLSTNLSGGGIDPSTGAYTAGSTGNVTDVVEVSDSLGNSVTAQVNVGPVVSLSPTTATVAPKGTQSFTASGGSGAGYTYSLSTNLSGGGIDPSTGAYTAGSTGNVTDVVEISDSLGNMAMVTINVGPGVTITPAQSATNPTKTILFAASGGSGTGYTYSLDSDPSGASIHPSTGVYTAGPSAGDTDIVSVTDSLGNRATATVVVGEAPIITPAAATHYLGESISFTASGGSGSGYLWDFASNLSGATINAATGAYTSGSTGAVTDVVRLTDSLGLTQTASVLLRRRTIPLPQPFYEAISPDGKELWATSSNHARVSIIDISTTAISATFSLGGPSAVAFSPDGAKVYIGGYEQATPFVRIYDAASRAVIATVPVTGFTRGIAFTPDGARAYVTSQGGGLEVIDTATYQVAAHLLTTIPVTSELAITPDGRRVYVALNNNDGVAVIDCDPSSGTYNSTLTTIPISGGPQGLVLDSSGTKAYVANAVGGGLSVVSTSTNTVDSTIAPGSSYISVVVLPNGSKAYASSNLGSSVDIIDLTNSTVIKTITGLTGSSKLIARPNGTEVYLGRSSVGSGSVSIIETTNDTTGP